MGCAENDTLDIGSRPNARKANRGAPRRNRSEEMAHPNGRPQLKLLVRVFGRIQRQSDQFLRIFRATKGVANPQALASAGSPFANVYAAGFRELQSQVSAMTGNPSAPKIKSLQAVTVNMQLASAEEVRR